MNFSSGDHLSDDKYRRITTERQVEHVAWFVLVLVNSSVPLIVRTFVALRAYFF